MRRDQAEAAPAGCAPDRDALWSRRMGMFWGGIWLVWLTQPLVAAWTQGSVAGVGAVLAFAGVYLWHFSLQRWVFTGRPAPRPSRAGSVPFAIARYVAMLGLAAAAMTTIGQDGAACLVFSGIAAMWTFPIQLAVVVAAATASWYWFLWGHLAGWQPDFGSVGGMAFGIVATMAGRVSAQRQRALTVTRTENAQLAVQAERNRMARDLHDILGHSLTVITVKSELAGRLLEAGAVDRARAEVADLERLSRDALADVRRAVQGYREISLAGELARAREALRAAGIRAVIPTTTDEVEGDERELYAWVVREGVTNVIRHSGASTCTILVGTHGASVIDDGAGSTDVVGNGLRGLQERAAAAGFVLQTSSRGGFTLSVLERGSREAAAV